MFYLQFLLLSNLEFCCMELTQGASDGHTDFKANVSETKDNRGMRQTLYLL